MFVNFNMHNEKICKDCGMILQGTYCHNCGQKDIEILSLKVIMSDFLSSLFSIDSKLFITLKNLLFKPGFLTKEYWDGKRSRYISPIRIYIVLSFIIFAVLPLSLSFLSDGNGFLFEASENDQLPTGYEGIGMFVPILKELEESGNDKIATLLRDGIKETQKRKITGEQIFFSAIPTSMFVLMPVFAVILYLILFRNKKLTYVHHMITVLHLHSTSFIIILMFLFFEYVGLNNKYHNVLLFYFWPILTFTFLSFFLKNIYNNSWVLTIIKSVILSSIYLITFIFGTIFIMFFAMALFGQPNI